MRKFLTSHLRRGRNGWGVEGGGGGGVCFIRNGASAPPYEQHKREKGWPATNPTWLGPSSSSYPSSAETGGKRDPLP